MDGLVLVVFGVIFITLVLIPVIVSAILRNVEAGTIRMVSWLNGSTVIYRGPGKSKEIPVFTTGTTISSKAINVDLDITDQTADLDETGTPRPIKVRVLASAIVSVGDTDQLIKTAANRFFSKPQSEQLNILIDLLSSSGRRAINLLTHDQLFSARSAPRPQTAVQAAAAQVAAQAAAQAAQNALAHGRLPVVLAEDDDDPLAIIIRKACSRELTDLGLIFNSLNIKVVMSEVAEARRRQSAAEAQANADIVAAQQARRAKEAQIEAERIISDRNRELEQTRAQNAALIAESEAKRQTAVAIQREAELKATQIAQATADADRVKIEVEARAQADAHRILIVADANAQSIEKINQAISKGGESYFRYRQLELMPQVVPQIAQALAQAKLVTISGGNDGGGAADMATNNITSVIQTVLAAQLVSRANLLDTPTPPADVWAPANSSQPVLPPAVPSALPAAPQPRPQPRPQNPAASRQNGS